MFSRFFINRPIFATVLAILMILAGLLTVKSLPVAQYPDITPPTVFVSANYPGADAQTVSEAVGAPIEEQVNGVEGMMYMSSSSGSDGSYSLEITFENGTDLDMATVKVQNRVSQAEPVLPASVKQQGVSVESRSSDIILFVALESTKPGMYDGLYLTNYAQLNVVDELSRIEGVGGVSAFGSGEYSSTRRRCGYEVSHLPMSWRLSRARTWKSPQARPEHRRPAMANSSNSHSLQADDSTRHPNSTTLLSERAKTVPCCD